MGQLFDYFRNDFKDGSTDFNMVTSTSSGAEPEVTVQVRVFYNSDTMVRYIGLFYSAESYSVLNVCAALRDARQTLQYADSNVHMWIGNDMYDTVGINVSDLPFSGRVLLYVDDYVSPVDRAEICDFGLQVGVAAQIRDKQYSDRMSEIEVPLAFVSHDSRDKDEVARPLALALQSLLCPVWYDEFALRPGDSLRESIDKGLREARKCILILSPNFLANPGWTKGEFNAAMNRHFTEGGSVLLPVWHNVSRSQVAAYSTLVTDIYAVNTTNGIDEVARRLLSVLKSS